MTDLTDYVQYDPANNIQNYHIFGLEKGKYNTLKQDTMLYPITI